MARNEIFIAALPQIVFDLLGDASTYSDWVVGSHEIRAADAGWPEQGTAFDHTVGRPPFTIRDHTSVTQSLPPVLLELRANARPWLGSARITIHLTPERDGTRVTMVEEPVNRLLTVLIGPLGHGLIRLRNAESLRRLKALGEGTRPRPRGRIPHRRRPATAACGQGDGVGVHARPKHSP
jgi:uncharacterized protein YndB with AHSA1/START domain